MDGDAMGAGIAGMDAVESLGGVNVISHGTKTETNTTWRGSLGGGGKKVKNVTLVDGLDGLGISTIGNPKDWIDTNPTRSQPRSHS